jgi:hypothetical protein
MDVADVMQPFRVDALKSIARQAGIPKTVTRKPELIAALERFMKSDPAGFVERLAPIERNLLAEAVHNNNRIDPAVFSAKYKVDCPVPRRYGDAASLIAMVVVRAEHSSQLETPRTIAALLKPFLEKPAAARPATIEQLPETLDLRADSAHHDATDVRPIHVYSGERTAFLELRRVLQLVHGGKLRVQPKSNRPTPATERAIAASLAEPDFDLELPPEASDKYSLKPGAVRAHVWPVLVQQCGWCKTSGETLRLTKAGREMLQNASPEAFRAGAERLAVDDRFDELNRVNQIRGQTGKGKRWMTCPSKRRDIVFDGLAECPENEWLEFAEAYRFVHATGHRFSVTEDPSILYIADAHYGSIYDSVAVDRQYLRALLFESLATLGMVDVAYVYPHYLWPELGDSWGADDIDYCGRYDGLLYVRLNALGAYCLRLTDQYSPPAADERKLFTVLPNREIAVTGANDLLPGDASMLELFASRQSDRLWRIDPQRLLDYVETGGLLEDVLRFVEEHAAEGIPETVRVFFNDFQAKAGAILGAEDASLIEFADPAVAALVAHDARAGKLCLPAGPRHVAVSKKNERAFRTALKKLGYVLP